GGDRAVGADDAGRAVGGADGGAVEVHLDARDVAGQGEGLEVGLDVPGDGGADALGVGDGEREAVELLLGRLDVAGDGERAGLAGGVEERVGVIQVVQLDVEAEGRGGERAVLGVVAGGGPGDDLAAVVEGVGG